MHALSVAGLGGEDRGKRPAGAELVNGKHGSMLVEQVLTGEVADMASAASESLQLTAQTGSLLHSHAPASLEPPLLGTRRPT